MNVFVACPYSPAPIADYRGAFKSVEDELQYVDFKFADEKINSDVILERIVEHIRQAQVCLCDITGWNPNVTLELGLALGMSKVGPPKKVQLMFHERRRLFGSRTTGFDLPVDIRGHARINYRDWNSLRSSLLALAQQEAGGTTPNATGAFAYLCENIHGLLGREPLLKSWEIAARLGMETPQIKPALDKLVQDGRVVKEGNHNNAVYHQKGYTPPDRAGSGVPPDQHPKHS